MQFKLSLATRNVMFLSFFIIFIFSTNLANCAEITGLVFEDANLNNKYDEGERLIPGVGVSNGERIVLTNSKGKYSLELGESNLVFIIKPSEYDLFEGKYSHKPIFYKNVEHVSGLGKTVNGINFPLIKSRITDNFSAIILGDMQVKNNQEIDYLRDAVIPELIERDAKFILTLGDNAYDNLEVYPRFTRVLGAAGKTIYYVPGNHDTNDKIEGPKDHYNIYRNHFGPDYYSFNYGKVHFIILNDIKWENGSYHGEIGEKQLNWIREDLKYVPKDNLVVLAMHIPLISWVDRNNVQHHVSDREELFKLLRDFNNVIALAGHTHDLEKLYPDDVIDGWQNGLVFPQIIAGAVCGSWWGGEKDEFGIPYSYMKDGAPKGYFIFNFNGNAFKDLYKVTGKPLDYQLNITLVNQDQRVTDNIISKSEINSSKIVANVFNADIYSDISISYDGGEYNAMERSPIIDPLLNEKLMGRTTPVESTHIWSSNIPSTMSTGAHTAKVKFVDKYGKEFITSKIFEIE